MKEETIRYLRFGAVFWLISAAGLLCFYVLFMRGQYEQLWEKRQRLAEVKALYKDAEQSMARQVRESLAADIVDCEEQFGRFVFEYESSSDLSFDVSEVVKAEDVDGFTMRSRGGGRRGEDGDYVGEEYVDVSFFCDFWSFVRVLNGFERHEPVILVDRFEITRSDREQTGHRVDMALAVLVKD